MERTFEAHLFCILSAPLVMLLLTLFIYLHPISRIGSSRVRVEMSHGRSRRRSSRRDDRDRGHGGGGR